MTDKIPGTKTQGESTPDSKDPDAVAPKPAEPKEVGGPTGPEPTRFGDWERKGRCIDF